MSRTAPKPRLRELADGLPVPHVIEIQSRQFLAFWRVWGRYPDRASAERELKAMVKHFGAVGIRMRADPEAVAVLRRQADRALSE